jgi:hypothetical protein
VVDSAPKLAGGGFSPDSIEPFDEPFTFPAFISGA